MLSPYIERTVSFSLNPALSNLWWKCLLSGKNGESLCLILDTITKIISNRGYENIIKGILISNPLILIDDASMLVAASEKPKK